MTTSNAWLVLRVVVWTAFALFGIWLGVATKTYWLIAVFVGIAVLGGGLELRSNRGSRVTLIQAGIIGGGLSTIATLAAIGSLAAIVDESQGVRHRPRRFPARLIHDTALDAFGSAGGALFWLLCLGAVLVAAILYVRKLLGKEKPDAT